MSETPDLLEGEHVLSTLPPSDWQASGLVETSSADAVRTPWKKGEVSSSGRAMHSTCQGSTGAHPHLAVFVLGGYSPEILA